MGFLISLFKATATDFKETDALFGKNSQEGYNQLKKVRTASFSFEIVYNKIKVFHEFELKVYPNIFGCRKRTNPIHVNSYLLRYPKPAYVVTYRILRYYLPYTFQKYDEGNHSTEVLYRLGRFCHELSRSTTDKNEIKRLLAEGK